MQESIYQAVMVYIGKINPDPGDILIFTVPKDWSDSRIYEFGKAAASFLPAEARFMVLTDDITVTKLGYFDLMQKLSTAVAENKDG